MDVVVLVEAILAKLFAVAPIPAFVQHLIEALVSRYLTADVVKEVEKEVRCWLCAELKKATASNAIEAQAAQVVCSAFGGDADCQA